MACAASSVRAKSRFDLQPKKLAADTAYGSGGNLAWLMERGIEPHIPVLDRSMQTNGVFTRNDFTFDRANNAFICPGGKSLPLAYERDNGILIYRARVRDCAGCALKPQCTKASSRVLSVNAHEDVRQHRTWVHGNTVGTLLRDILDLNCASRPAPESSSSSRDTAVLLSAKRIVADSI